MMRDDGVAMGGLTDGAIPAYDWVIMGAHHDLVANRVWSARKLVLVCISKGAPVWQHKLSTRWMRRFVPRPAR